MTALRKILVVDDDPVVATSFDRVLSRDGYIVVKAASGAEALEKLNDGEYDVVYTDIRMPGMDGLELAETVKARRSWTPVVIITGYGNEAAEQRARAAGVTAFLHKPLSPDIIETSARDAIEHAAPAEAHAPAAAPAAVEAPAHVPPTTAPAEGGWRYGAMFVAGPLLGLAFAVLLPFVGLATLAGMAARAFWQSRAPARIGRFLKNAALFFAAPFIGLAYIVLLPVVGIGTFIWVAVHGQGKKAQHN